jgi:hypothetical protein
MANTTEMKPDRRKEMIRRRMARTRTALAEKLELLGERIRGATEVVQSVTGAVQNTVHTVQSVTETFDVMRHPLLMFAGSIAVGYVGGVLLHRDAHRAAMPCPPSFQQPAATLAPPPQAEQPSGLVGQLAGALGTEAQKLKRMAVGTAVGTVRDLFAPDIPEPMRPFWQDLAKKVAGWLGGDLPAGPTFVSPNGQARSTGGDADGAGQMGTGELHTRAPEQGKSW